MKREMLWVLVWLAGVALAMPWLMGGAIIYAEWVRRVLQ